MLLLVVLEIKPLLSDPFAMSDVIECLLQGYYSTYTHNVSVLSLCLTDLRTWWYYLIENLLRTDGLPTAALPPHYLWQQKRTKMHRNDKLT